MSRVTLEEAKSFLNVYFDEKDLEIQLFIDAAERHVLNWLNRSDWTGLVEQLNSPVVTESDEVLFPNIKVGILMYVNDFWQNREIAVIGSSVAENRRASEMLYLYRRELGV